MSTDLNSQFLKAVFREDIILVQHYVRDGADVNYISSEQDSALLIAIDTMNIELISFLLAHAANPNPDSAQVYTLPLNLVVDVVVQAVLNEEADVPIELLLRYGANFTVSDQSGKNALEMAANYNSAARQLFEARLDS